MGREKGFDVFTQRVIFPRAGLIEISNLAHGTPSAGYRWETLKSCPDRVLVDEAGNGGDEVQPTAAAFRVIPLEGVPPGLRSVTPRRAEVLRACAMEQPYPSEDVAASLPERASAHNLAADEEVGTVRRFAGESRREGFWEVAHVSGRIELDARERAHEHHGSR